MVSEPKVDVLNGESSVPEGGPIGGGEQIERLRRTIHQTIHAVSNDLDLFHFNKAVARIRELTNALDEMDPADELAPSTYRYGMEVVVLLIAPMMPHIAEEMWLYLGHEELVVDTPWPEYDASLLQEDSVTMGVQVNGKIRGTAELPRDCSQEEAESAALGLKTVVTAMGGKPVKKMVYVPNRIINVVV